MFDLLAQSLSKASELTWPQVVNGAICPVCILLVIVAMFWCGGKAGTVKVVKVYGSKDKDADAE